MKPAKTKAKTMPRVPQTREDAVWAIGRIGALRREVEAHQAVANEAVRVAGEELEKATADIIAELAEHERGMQAWAEANRMALTGDGRVKFHDFGTGKINWRVRPPKVTVRAVDTVIEACRKLGLTAFLREKVEINKEAMLADPDAARAIAGVTISSEGEDFVIEPAELETSPLNGTR